EGGPGQPLGEECGRAVGAAVHNKNDFEVPAQGRVQGPQRLQERRDRRLVLVDGDDEGVHARVASRTASATMSTSPSVNSGKHGSVSTVRQHSSVAGSDGRTGDVGCQWSGTG